MVQPSPSFWRKKVNITVNELSDKDSNNNASAKILKNKLATHAYGMLKISLALSVSIIIIIFVEAISSAIIHDKTFVSILLYWPVLSLASLYKGTIILKCSIFFAFAAGAFRCYKLGVIIALIPIFSPLLILISSVLGFPV